MKAHPILFSATMVRAILAGRKTQTRRVISPQPADSWMKGPVTDWANYYKDGRKYLWIAHPDNIHKEITCPYGAPGDRLWVRETWRVDDYDPANTIYLAEIPDSMQGDKDVVKWRPSIFMPRERSRLSLEIINVRVGRLQEIDSGDIDAEGVSESWWPDSNRFAQWQKGWDALNAKRGYGWDKNPWVWVIEFKRAIASNET